MRFDVEAFAKAHAHGAVVVDVREPSEHATGHLPSAKLMAKADDRG